MSTEPISAEQERDRSASSSEEDEEELNFSRDDGWQDVEEGKDQEEVQYVSLFDEAVFSTMEKMLAHDREEHGFDLVSKAKGLGRCVCMCQSSEIVTETYPEQLLFFANMLISLTS